MEQERLLRDRECWDFLNVSRSAFWLGVKNGTLPPGFLLTPGARRWRLSDLLAFIDGRASDENRKCR